jgi:hypothetical protein
MIFPDMLVTLLGEPIQPHKFEGFHLLFSYLIDDRLPFCFSQEYPEIGENSDAIEHI